MKGLGFKMANIHGDEMQNELETLVGGQRGLLEKELKMPFLRAAEKISCQDPQRQKAWARPERQARCLRARGRSGIHQELHPRRLLGCFFLVCAYVGYGFLYADLHKTVFFLQVPVKGSGV